MSVAREQYERLKAIFPALELMMLDYGRTAVVGLRVGRYHLSAYLKRATIPEGNEQGRQPQEGFAEMDDDELNALIQRWKAFT